MTEKITALEICIVPNHCCTVTGKKARKMILSMYCDFVKRYPNLKYYMKEIKSEAGIASYSLYRTLDDDDVKFAESIEARHRKAWEDDVIELEIDGSVKFLNEYIRI